MDIDFSHHEPLRHLGGSATHPRAPRSRRHAALLGLAGKGLPRSRPCRSLLRQRRNLFVLSKSAQADLEPQHEALPGTPITAPSGAFN